MAKSKLDYLQIKHLTGTQAEIAEVIGIEAYRKLVVSALPLQSRQRL